MSIVGIYEIAQMANVSPQAVCNWRKRYADFPEPFVQLKMGPLFKSRKIKTWLKKRTKKIAPNYG